MVSRLIIVELEESAIFGLFYRAVFLVFYRMLSFDNVSIILSMICPHLPALQVKSRDDLTAKGESFRTEYCSYEEAKMWGIQKMLAFRYAVELEQDKFRFVI